MAIWRTNLRALMDSGRGTSADELAKAVGVNPKTIKRILDPSAEHETGIDVISKIAAYFDLAVWQVLVPDLQPTNPPMLAKEAQAMRNLLENINRTKEAIEGSLSKGGNTRPADL